MNNNPWKTKKETRIFPLIDSRTGKIHENRINYKLWFREGKLEDIRNEHGYSIEKQSECWDFFNRKYQV